MKITFPIRKLSSMSAKLALLLCLANVGILPAAADDAPLVATTISPTDVSTFPPLSQLPGKVPKAVYKGLPVLWAKHHEEWKASASNDLGAVVFLGDSITEGWKTLAQDFPNLKVANRGIGGDITSGVLYRLQADVLSLKPKAIVLLIGTNDLGQDADPEDIASNVKLILEAVRNYDPKLKVILCKVLPRGGRPERHFVEKIKKINSLEADYAKDMPNVTICDTFTPLADAQGEPIAADFRDDHLHLIPAGYTVWKETLTPGLASLNLSTDPVK
jgi:lysophospholipase L1-like esterase